MLITAWWDVYRQFAPGHNPRRRRVRPLRVLERALGHRVQISGYSRFERRPPDEYQYTAFSWLDAATIDDAVHFVLRQLSSFGGPIHDGASRLNRQAIDSDDELEHTIGTFYWNTQKQAPLVDIASAGVLLSVTSNGAWHHDSRAIQGHTIHVPRISSPKSNFAIVAELALMGDPKDVRELHWPHFRDGHFMHGFEIVSLKGRSGPGNPSHFTVRRAVVDSSEAKAICTALASVQGITIKLGFGTEVLLEAIPSSQASDGLRSLYVLREC